MVPSQTFNTTGEWGGDDDRLGRRVHKDVMGVHVGLGINKAKGRCNNQRRISIVHKTYHGV